MLKAGIYTRNGELYQIYIVEEKGYSRLDIMEYGADFQVDVDKILFSTITRRNCYTYGDKALYDDMMAFRNEIENVQKTYTNNGDWVDSQYVMTKVGVNEKHGIRCETKLVNNDPVEMTMSKGNDYYQEYVLDAVYGIKLDPINFKDYELMTLSKDNVQETQQAPYHSLTHLKRKFDIGHIYKNDYMVADDIDTAKRRLKEWYEADVPYKGFDTETTGTDVDMYGEDYMVGIILGETETKSTYFPFFHEQNADGDDPVHNLDKEFLDLLMSCVIEQQWRCVAHNKKFDRKVMLKCGYDVHIKWCTMQISIVLNPIIKKGVHGLKHLMLILNGKSYLELTDIFISAADINFGILPKGIVHAYACSDGSSVIELIKAQMKMLPKKQMKLVELECDLADLIADQEYYGIRVDVPKYEKQYRNCNYILEQLMLSFRQLTREDGKITSAQVLSNLLYNKMHCKVLLRTKTGAPSTSTAAIQKLAKTKRVGDPVEIPDIKDLFGDVVIKGKDLAATQYPALLILAKHKEYVKLKTAYYARFERTMKTGRVFFWVNQNGTLTGRQSSPMHQLPAALKHVILSDSPTKAFWGPDYSQVELRMLAYQAEEEKLIEMCKDPDNDIHRVIGSLLNNCEMWEITPEQRSLGKRRNFGAVYLISGQGLALQMMGPGYTEADVEFCQKQLDDFFLGFPRINRFIKRNAEKVKEQGYMETKWYYRKRIFEEVFDPDVEPRRMASILRMANNMPIQGTSADLMKLAMVQMYNYIYDKGWNVIGEDGFPMVRIMLSIHDELIISTDMSIVMEEIVKMITLCMDIPVKGAPPFFVQPAYMSDWGQHSADDIVMPIRLRDKLIEDYDKTGVSVINYENYLDTLNEFRAGQLLDYMNDMIAKYGTDYKILGEEIRHPSLSHSLLDLFKDDIKSFRKDNDPTQRECLVEATRLYIERRMQGGDFVALHMQKSATKEDERMENPEEYDPSLFEPLVNFDSSGELIVYDEDEYEDDFYSMEDTEVDKASLRMFTDPVYSFRLADTIVTDVQDLANEEEINKVIAELYHHKDDNGFFSANIVYKGKLINLGFRIEEIDLTPIDKLINDLIKARGYVTCPT